MMLFAIELPDTTAYLVPASNVHAAIDEAERRSGVRPAYIWVLTAGRRIVVAPDGERPAPDK